jgi:3-mercaptopyruvate sulfurtransferase SseA
MLCNESAAYAGTRMTRASENLGHFLESVNMLHENTLICNHSKEFKSSEEIKIIFDSEGITPGQIAILSRVSGCLGTALYFAAPRLDFQKAAVHIDGWLGRVRKHYTDRVELQSCERSSEVAVNTALPTMASRMPEEGR